MVWDTKSLHKICESKHKWRRKSGKLTGYTDPVNSKFIYTRVFLFVFGLDTKFLSSFFEDARHWVCPLNCIKMPTAMKIACWTLLLQIPCFGGCFANVSEWTELNMVYYLITLYWTCNTARFGSNYNTRYFKIFLIYQNRY